MPDYQKSKIYKLVSEHTDEIYIGSTIQKLCIRLSGHACDFRKGKNKYSSKKLFELGKVKIILIENVPCDSKEELLKHERNYIETMDCVNKNMPGRTKSEYYHDNKEEILKQKKEYKRKNIDKIKERNKEYYLKNKDKIKEYDLKNIDKIKERKKEYYLKNKDKLKEQKKEHYLKNKDTIKERSKVRTICDCGLDMRKDSISKHKKSKNHIKLMEFKTEVPTL
tara:strand:+ start:351 stop:1019 length:669 start_codon:yes stop_codon:yes gene_type:complete